MRLIDADKLLKNAHIRESEEGNIFVKEWYCIEKNTFDNTPTVEAIPMSVIEDIKAEIENMIEGGNHCDEYIDGYECGLKYTLKIIDKHISGKESE